MQISQLHIYLPIPYAYYVYHSDTEKKVKPKWLHPGAVLENGATLLSGAVFP